ncbi:MAG: hypothetical protein CVU46_03975 [Chloroflexi bacterium HGW-Chloroflexi-8]|nr:MAG: hypothetical protein CVU46_03975 [Chloroflexi bacterium HGW-Chloroflexi-8]
MEVQRKRVPRMLVDFRNCFYLYIRPIEIGTNPVHNLIRRSDWVLAPKKYWHQNSKEIQDPGLHRMYILQRHPFPVEFQGNFHPVHRHPKVNLALVPVPAFLQQDPAVL